MITYTVTNGSGCVSAVTKNITVTALPSAPTDVIASPASLCSGTSTNLKATSAGNNINWYTEASAGTLLGTSASGIDFTYTTSTATTYYAEAVTLTSGTSGTQTYNYTGSTQEFTVPAGVTSISIEAWGAQGSGGGSNSLAGGKGARMKGTVNVTPGDKLTIMVGEKGGTGSASSDPHGNENGGGGGTFVVRKTVNVPLVIAGGGGGGPSTAYGTSCTRTAADADGQTGTSGVTIGCSSTGNGGTGGNGGSAAGTYEGGAGGGFTTNGANGGTHCALSYGGKSYLNGGARAAGNSCYSTTNYGGYGGGGGGQLSGPGGGGGYSGGGTAGQWSSYSTYGGGGGSFNAGPSGTQSNTAGVQTGNGQVIITWTATSTAGCASPRASVAVAITPAASIGSVTGTTPLCINGTATYTANTVVLSGGTGAWSSSNTGIATVNASTGSVTPVAAGTCNIIYTVTGGCGGTKTAQQSLTVVALPVLAAITGSLEVCNGASTTFSNSTASGVWTSSATGVASVVSNTGVITGVSAGTSVITYTVTNGSGCVSAVTKNITVTALPSAPTDVIASPASLCSGTSTNLKATSAGNNINWYTEASAGTLLGTSASGIDFTYTTSTATTYYAEAVTLTSGTSGTQTYNYTGSTQEFTVPAGVTSISIEAWGAQGSGGGSNSLAGGKGARMKGTVNVTPGDKLTIMVGEKGGTGSASSDPHGNENGGGGGTFVVRKTVNVPLVIAGGGGGGPSTAYGTSCTRTAADADGQTGTSGVTIGCSSTGNGGTGGNGGSAAGTYEGGAGGGFTTNGANGGTHCALSYGGKSYLNGGARAAGNSCYSTTNYGGYGGGGGGQLSGPGGGGGYSGGGTAGQWSSYSTYGGGGGSYNAGISGTQSNTAGVQTGNGQVIITWTANSTAGCASPRASVAVAITPAASIGSVTGTTPLCINGTATYTANTVVLSGGTGAWSSSNTGIATVNATTGVVTAVAAGTCNIIYTITGGCVGTATAQQSLTIAALPVLPAITGSTVVCKNSKTTLSNSQTGGTWSSGSTAVATIDATSGEVTGVSPGSSVITYTASVIDVCPSVLTKTITVNVSDLPAQPTSVSATPASLCSGASSNLNATSAGNNIKWYTVETGGTSIGTSASGVNFAYTTNATTTYYAEAVTVTSQTFNYSGSIVSFTVPAGVTSLEIEALGAQGGNTTSVTYPGGKGAREKGTVTVTPGQVLKILVGQQGYGTNYSYSGGGGGTFVTSSSNAPLMIAGGGGGGNSGGGYAGSPGQITTSGAGSSRSVAGGTGGNGGGGGTGGGGGGGLTTDGATGSSANYNPGKSFANGGAGALATVPGNSGNGGFGGGGSGDGNNCGMGGAGGGYSGGGGGGSTCGQGIGGGGGSFNAGTTKTETAGYQSGNGQVIITWSGTGTSCPSAARTPVTVTIYASASIGSVTGTTPLCIGDATTYSAGSTVLSGGTGAWSSSDTSKATVNATTGVVTAIAEGNCNIIYTITGGCGGTVSAQQTLTVPAPPVSTAITGVNTVCVSGTSALANATAGGTWSSGSSGIATIDASSGLVTGVSAGSSVITYSKTVGTCTSSVTIPVYVSARPAVPTSISANPTSVCVNTASNLKATVETGNMINWYTVSSGGTSLGTSVSGANFSVTPVTSGAENIYYAEAVTVTSQTINYSGSIVNFTVPAGVTSLDIDAMGAQGGNTTSVTYPGGKGARVKGTVTVTPGQTLKILVGQQGFGTSYSYSGGGGGTFVTTSNNSALMVAGGGGGGNAGGQFAGSPGQITTSGAGSNRSIAGGTSGNGGGGGASGGGGGGLSSDGTTGSGNNGKPGKSFLNGGAGALADVPGNSGNGGFGGGGSGDGNNCGMGGAGGGYSGGGGGGSTCGQGIGGGGGSYNGGASGTQTNTSGDNTGNGKVIITWTATGVSCPSISRTPVTLTTYASAIVGSLTGTTPLCIGATATYSAGSAVLSGGTGVWSSSNTGVATVNASTGAVTAIAAGNCNIISRV